MSFAYVASMYDDDSPTPSVWTDYPSDREYPSYCTGFPCDSAGNGRDINETLYIGLNTKTDSPGGIITAAGEIIAYLPIGDDAKTYGTDDSQITLDGQAVIGFGCWGDWQRLRSGIT